MPAALVAGQLVEIVGLAGPVETAAGWHRRPGEEPRDMNGQQGQLTEWNEEDSTWSVATFGAAVVAVREENLRPLTDADVRDFDIAFGPASDPGLLGTELMDKLLRSGHALCKLFVAPDDLHDVVALAERCEEDGAFSRLPTELEPGYLGKGGRGKTMTVDLEDPDTADFIRQSPLKVIEDAISTVGTVLQPFSENDMGFDVYSRSSTMLVMPLGADEESYPPPDLDNEDTANFLTMMWRAKLLVIANVGPAAATLSLQRKAQDGEEATITVAPGTLAVFMTDQYKFSYKPEGGQGLSMMSFFLDAPTDFVLDKVEGDISTILDQNAGPPAPKKNHVSVVALAERYAFGVDEPWKLWMAYRWAGWDTIIRHPFQRWDIDWYYEPDADQTSGKSYTCHGGFSDGIEYFDCKFFDISPAEARGMDPTQRQVLEVSYMALQGGGWTKKQLQSKPANVAIMVGLDKNEWQSIPKDISGGFGASNSANAITSGRVNYCLNLKGASMTIDTACSASLVATHTGKLYLLHKDYDPCEASITCGVNLSLSVGSYIGCCGAGMHSHLGRCFTYNFSADGYTRGEATAATCIKLKSLDSEAGDYAMYAGSQVNQDGRSASLTAPNGPSQERCSEAVLKEIGIEPPEVDTTECHGTGTSLGDPIEVGAYRKVMARVPRTDPVTITSSKSNVGHCEGSAGVSGFTKCVLLCMYGEGTPNCHLSCLNPHLDMDGFPGIITTEGCCFKGTASYNGVLSFGFGGTNACATCWGPNTMTSRGSVKGSRDVHAMVLSRIRSAAAQEVTITSDDWEDWEMDFPGRSKREGEAWEVDVGEDGGVLYTRRVAESAGAGDSYELTGSFNDWGYEPLEADPSTPGLYTASVEIGADGEERFQVVADEDPGMTFHPGEASCTRRSTEILGPGEAERENAWLIKGAEGDRFRIEFFRSPGNTVTLSWIKEAW